MREILIVGINPTIHSYQVARVEMLLRKNHFYDLQTIGYQEIPPNLVIGILKYIHIDVYYLLDLSANFSFEAPFITMNLMWPPTCS